MARRLGDDIGVWQVVFGADFAEDADDAVAYSVDAVIIEHSLWNGCLRSPRPGRRHVGMADGPRPACAVRRNNSRLRAGRSSRRDVGDLRAHVE